MHPKYHISKTYEADIKGSISEDSINILKNGILIDGYKTAPAKVKLINRSQKNTSVQISIHEGKNRQVRKMFEKIGHRVIKLKRISFGNINLGGLMEGQWIYLTDDEIKYLKK